MSTGSKSPEVTPDSTTTVCSVSALLESVDPLRHLHLVVEIVRKLNEIGMEKLGCSQASFEGSDHHLSISWGGCCLWDSEGYYKEELDFDDDGVPSFDNCRRILLKQSESSLKAFSEIK